MPFLGLKRYAASVMDVLIINVVAGCGYGLSRRGAHQESGIQYRAMQSILPFQQYYNRRSKYIRRRPTDTETHNQGYLWGASLSINMSASFDLLILADVVFNHTEHAKLVSSIHLMLRRTSTSRVLVFFTPYRPWLLEKDLEFFKSAKEGGFVVEKVLETVMEKAMFVDDRGDELLRRTVFGYELQWQE